MYRDQMSATTVFKIVFFCGVMSSLKEKKNKVMTYSSLFITCVAVWYQLLKKWLSFFVQTFFLLLRYLFLSGLSFQLFFVDLLLFLWTPRSFNKIEFFIYIFSLIFFITFKRILRRESLFRFRSFICVVTVPQVIIWIPFSGSFNLD